MPSRIFFDVRPAEVKTILGSCVAICLFDPVLRIGGMNHYMLPYWTGEGRPSEKYGDIAIEMLVEKLLNAGSSSGSLRAKVFGGAEQFGDQPYEVGLRNVECAKEVLYALNIPIVGFNVAGKKGRKITFTTDTGQVRLQFLPGL
ncbi:chemotaxis protein CheD [Chryseolinea lacunae]|uniref:Probable chemoreceptor glutamine deamidase CheD n=1 Tax=Chryseolinea lacunae TaxID=2801331 RepID=A0ABS1KMN4_9BACT|nr:chemotaxis protein CheD [Chryseolinea lacunae]MBL0740599.1 chemotaxis protein CheD [Chryseolinea lacunae]